MREEINIGDITRHLSEATADAEMFFAEQSFYMTMEQLQRYGTIQKVFDNLTFQLFETEIERNRAVIQQALSQGDYFIINLTFNSIKSSYYMMYSKQKIKTEQNQKLADLDKELEATQAMVKVLKALEGVIKVEDISQLNFQKIQKALEIYVTYFSQSPQIPTKIACDRRLYLLFKNHFELLGSHQLADEGALKHLAHACHLIQPLALNQELQQMLQGWRDELVEMDRRLKQANSKPAVSESPVQPESLPEFRFKSTGKTGDSKSSTPSAAQAPPEERSALAGAPSIMLKMLDNIETVTQLGDQAKLDYAKIQTAIRDYIETIGKVGENPAKSACDDKLFALIEEHVDFLYHIDFGGDPDAGANHISVCCDLLQELAQKPIQQHMLEAWRAIKSSVFMMYTEQIVKSQQDQQLASLERELETGQVLLKALKQFEKSINVASVDLMDFQAVQKALRAYVEVIRKLEPSPTRELCDERIFTLFGEHMDVLYTYETGSNMAVLAAHITTCCGLLESMAQEQVQWQMLVVWRSMKEDQLKKFAALNQQKMAQQNQKKAAATKTAPVPKTVPPVIAAAVTPAPAAAARPKTKRQTAAEAKSVAQTVKAAQELQAQAAQAQVSPPSPVQTSQNKTASDVHLEDETLQKMVGVLENLIQIDHISRLDYISIQQALRRYISATEELGSEATRSICNEQIFSLFEAHIDFLYEHEFGGDANTGMTHILKCCNLLETIAQNTMQMQILSVWRSLPPP